MKKIIFYDLETTGRSAYWDQIIQIAAICTDEHLNVIDEINLIGKLNSYAVPDPEALLVNKIPIDRIVKYFFFNYLPTSKNIIFMTGIIFFSFNFRCNAI